MFFDPLLLVASHVTEAAQSGNIVSNIAGQFGVNWKLLVAQIINFGIVTYLLYRFAFKPVIKTLDERREKIENGLKYTEEMEKKLKDAERYHAEVIKKSAAESKKIMDAARQQAKNYTEIQAQEAISKAEEIIKGAHQAMAHEKKQMLSDVRKEVASLVVSTSEKVLSKELSTNERSRFSQSAAKELAI